MIKFIDLIKELFKKNAVSFYIKRYYSESLENYLAGCLFASWEINTRNHNIGACWRDKSDYVDIAGSFKDKNDALLWLEKVGAKREYGLGDDVYVNASSEKNTFAATAYEIVRFDGSRKDMRILKGQLMYDGAVRKNVFGVYTVEAAKSRIKRGAALAAENPKFAHNIQMFCVDPL